jgi:dephospho-CoA kinase
MIRVGVTGGIGSGKTMVCRAFESLGVPVYYADLAARALIDSQKDIRDKLIALFGSDIYVNNTLNRPRFASIVFNDKQLLETANNIIHPRVHEDFCGWAKIHVNKNYIIEEAAILFESGGNVLVDKCITVISPVEIRIKRLMKRPGMTMEKIEGIMATQWPDEKKLEYSDFVIMNDEKTLITPQILLLHQQLTNLGLTFSKAL